MRENPGKIAEDKVEAALRLLVRDENKPRFVWCERASGSKKGGSREIDWADQKGIDFILFLDNHLALPLQIKAGKKKKQYILRHYKNHPHILALGIREAQTPEKIALRIEKIVNSILRNPHKRRVRNVKSLPD